MVEFLPSKQAVAGSSPVSRSTATQKQAPGKQWSLFFYALGPQRTILILLVYIATCIAAPFFYRREHREEFNILRHIVLPIVPAIILLFPIYARFVPAPPFPHNLAGPICAGWLVVGILVAVFLRLRRPQALAMSDKVFIEE